MRPVIVGDEFITGTLDNTPKVVQTVRLGQTVRSPKSNIFDWLYVSQGIRYGAFTVEALQQLLTLSEAA